MTPLVDSPPCGPRPIPDQALDLEVAIGLILDMISRQCEPTEVLRALCEQVGRNDQERQVAMFTLEGDLWTLAATGDLNRQSRETLFGLMPEYVSGLLLGDNPTASHRPSDPHSGFAEAGQTAVLQSGPDEAQESEQDELEPGPTLDVRDGVAFEDGWARHLYSGIGEILALLVCFAPGPFVPRGRRALRIDAICRLTIVAIEQWNLREELNWQGNHDSITGLYTQAFLERTLGAHLQHVSSPVAILHVNLDRFRLVNDVLGRALGNRILRFIGQRFSSCTHQADLIARPGGDEFALLLNPGTAEHASAMATHLLHSLTSPLSVDGHQVFISASIGIACSHPGSTAHSLQREAYVALYHAKKDGKARALHFDPSMAATPPERLEMEKCLRSAIARNEMLLYYQPQIDLATGRVAGAEALLRWNPSGVGIISPGAIIPILEETGLIVDFGRWALREACAQGKRWLDETGIPVRIGANVSALQVRHPGYVAEVERALADSGYPAEYIELELTESVFVGDYGRARDTLLKLRALGVTLALDDFGTGRSSLSYLQELPFHRLKIDQSFVRGLSGPTRCPSVIENIVNMAKSLDMLSIAEGIDDENQAEVLRSMSCDEGQGYLYSVPLPPDEFLRYRESVNAQA